MIRLTFHGHAAFSIESAGFPHILIDPYRPLGLGGRLRLPEIRARAQLVLVTHHHEDHAWLGLAQAEAVLADESGIWLGVQLAAVPAFHDREQGARMGLVSMLGFTVGGLRVVHLGDIGVPPSRAQWSALGKPDVLLVPAGGTYTIDAAQAAQVARDSGATWVVPMHCAHPLVDLPLEPVEAFVAAWGGPSERATACAVDLDPGARPQSPVALVVPPCATTVDPVEEDGHQETRRAT